MDNQTNEGAFGVAVGKYCVISGQLGTLNQLIYNLPPLKIFVCPSTEIPQHWPELSTQRRDIIYNCVINYHYPPPPPPVSENI